ncbi:hypothetical protein, partial [Plasmodium yoelii yoelii]
KNKIQINYNIIYII